MLPNHDSKTPILVFASVICFQNSIIHSIEIVQENNQKLSSISPLQLTNKIILKKIYEIL